MVHYISSFLIVLLQEKKIFKMEFFCRNTLSALYFEGATQRSVVVENCQFLNNAGPVNVSGINGEVNFTNCIFSDNAQGGAISVTNSSVINLDNCTLNRNSALFGMPSFYHFFYCYYHSF
jgi:hypothetical protein